MYTTMLITVVALFSFGCSTHNYSQSNDTSMDKPMIATKDSREMYQSSRTLHGDWTNWPYKKSWTE